MAWEVLAIWAIVGSVVVWFLRDERQRRDRKLSARAKRFATTPHGRANRPSLEEETLVGAYAALSAMPPPPAPAKPVAPVVLAPHDLEFIAQLRSEALEQV